MRAAAAASTKYFFALALLFVTTCYYTNVVLAEITSIVTNETWPLLCVDDDDDTNLATSIDTPTSPFSRANAGVIICEEFCGAERRGSISVLGSHQLDSLINDNSEVDSGGDGDNTNSFNGEGVVISQYQVCACDYIAIGTSNDGTVNITFADGQKACKFDEKELVFPTSTVDNNNETVACADIGLNRDGSDCNDYCSDVVFKDFAPDTPVNSISSGSSDPAYISGCTCSWKNMNIDACMGSSGGGAAIDGAMQFSKVFIVTAIVSSIMALFF